MISTAPTSLLSLGALVASLLGVGAGGPPATGPRAAPFVQPLMGEPLPGLTQEELARFLRGAEAFAGEVTGPEGLGPVFNDVGCAVCHRDPVVGGFGNRFVTRFGRRAGLERPEGLERLGGSLLQSQAINPACVELLPPEADVIGRRLTPHLFGSGLVELVPDAVLVAQAARQPDGVRGRVHRVVSLADGSTRVGRFGWKAQIATLLDFSADASLEELGLTNRLLPEESAPNGDPAKLALYDRVPDPEDGPDEHGFDRIDRFTDFQRMLAPPPQTPSSGMSGEAVFDSIGCADCHVAEYTTPHHPSAAFSEVTFRPYSDFLLHDMGALGDGIAQGAAGPNEMRTMPLWGIAQREFLMHDGASTGGSFAENVGAAIARHEGEGAAARDAFLALPSERREQLLGFLGSLGRAEFDADGDNDRDEDDWRLLRPFLSAPGVPVDLDGLGAVGDADRDGDFDLVDLRLFRACSTDSHSGS